jgi:hypothetical protein
LLYPADLCNKATQADTFISGDKDFSKSSKAAYRYPNFVGS